MHTKNIFHDNASGDYITDSVISKLPVLSYFMHLFKLLCKTDSSLHFDFYFPKSTCNIRETFKIDHQIKDKSSCA